MPEGKVVVGSDSAGAEVGAGVEASDGNLAGQKSSGANLGGYSTQSSSSASAGASGYSTKESDETQYGGFASSQTSSSESYGTSGWSTQKSETNQWGPAENSSSSSAANIGPSGINMSASERVAVSGTTVVGYNVSAGTGGVNSDATCCGFKLTCCCCHHFIVPAARAIANVAKGFVSMLAACPEASADCCNDLGGC